MAIRGKASALGLSMLVVYFSMNCCLAQDGGPQIGRAIKDITISVREGPGGSLPLMVRECYRKLLPNMGVDKVAYCFGLDYSASQLSQTLAARSDTESVRFLSIEKVLTRVNRALSARKIEQAERGPLIAFWANSSRRMLIKVEQSEKSGQTQNGPTIERAKTAILKLISDPGRARLSDLKISITPNMRGEPTEVVCGRVSERLGTGAYAASQPFVYFVNDQSANYDNGSQDLDREIVENFCPN